MESGDEDYVRLQQLENGGAEGSDSRCLQRKYCSLRCWLRVIIVCLCILVPTVAFVYATPWIVRKVIIPFLDWEMTTFSTPVRGLIPFTAIAILPSLLLPSFPFILMLGVTFGFVFTFVLVTTALCIGMSLPFFIGSFFRRRINGWLEKWPKKAAVVKLAGDGDWFHQFRVITFLRISPFPYALFNYASVASDVKYGPYIAGSVVGTMHENFLTIFSGRLLRSLVDAAKQGGDLSMQQVINNSIGYLVISLVTTALTIYARRSLQALQTLKAVNAVN